MAITPVIATSKVTEVDWKYPAANPNRTGMLQVDDNPPHTLSWEEYGNPDGEPVMFLHGGPGGACDPILSRFFDPDRYRVILFDQRGCGNSRPSVATDGPQIALANNTTDDLVEDIEKLRTALNIDSTMHVFGGSWGSTLAVAYAIKHPESVETLILRGIFTGERENLEYMYQGNAQTYAQYPNEMNVPGSYISYPEAWKTFVEVIPPNKRGDMMGAYKEIFDMVPTNDEERTLQMKAAITWSVWEGVISNLIPDMANVGKFDKDDFAVCFAQIEAHYFANNLFLEGGYLLDNVDKFAHIPVHIVHGRFDQVCPLTQAEMLVAALQDMGVEPASYVKTTAGHSALERENYLALTAIMDSLPRMKGFDLTPPVAKAAEAPKPIISCG